VGKIGLVAARNESLRLARGQFIVCLDSDDILVPTLLDAYQRLLQDHPTVDVIYGNLVAADAALNRIGEFTYQQVPDYPHSVPNLFASNRLPHPGSAARISLVREVGGYRAGTDGAVDYALWLDLAVARARFVHVQAHVAFYRRHGTNISGDAVRIARWDRSVVASAIERFTDRQLFPALDWTNPQRATLAATAIGLSRMLETGCDTDMIQDYLCSRTRQSTPALEESVC
jgi:glycosyltransferase involved in cell wall biosynthesis